MKRWTIVIVVLLAAACLVWIAVAQMPDGRLHVTFLDVESGQGILVRSPTGRVILIDGGAQPSALLSALGRRMPFWQRSLYAVIATHGGVSAVASQMDVCRRYDVMAALAATTGDQPTATFLRWRDTLVQRRIPFREATAGLVLDTEDGVKIEVTAADKGHLALRLTYGEVSLLMPGIEPTTAPLAATLVALPSNAERLRRATFDPSVNAAVFFRGSRMQQASNPAAWPQVQVYDTAMLGAIEMVSDGRGMQIKPIR